MQRNVSARYPRGRRIARILSDSQGNFCNLSGCRTLNCAVPTGTRGDGDQGDEIRLSGSPQGLRYVAQYPGF